MKLHLKTALPEMLHSITMLNPLASSIPLPKKPIFLQQYTDNTNISTNHICYPLEICFCLA